MILKSMEGPQEFSEILSWNVNSRIRAKELLPRILKPGAHPKRLQEY
jgi:hypothetical protein